MTQTNNFSPYLVEDNSGFDSNGSSMASGRGGAARGRTTRPISYVLTSRNGDPSSIRGTWSSSRPNRESSGCQICRGGARCWCPDGHVMRVTSPGDNRQPRQRGNRSTRQGLSRCSTCGKMYLPANTSHQWCCYGWLSESSEHSSPNRWIGGYDEMMYRKSTIHHTYIENHLL